MITEEALRRSRAAVKKGMADAVGRRDNALLQEAEAKAAVTARNRDIDDWIGALDLIDAMELHLFGPVKEAAE